MLDSGSANPLSPIKMNSEQVTAFGDLRTAELTPVFQGSFEYTVGNTELTTNAGVNGGTVTQANGMAVIGSSITTASTALLMSRRHARYRAGFGGLMRFTSKFSTPVADTEMYAGLADENGSSAAFKNGIMIGYDGVDFGFHRFRNDAKFSVLQTAFNVDNLDGSRSANNPSGMLLDNTKLNVWAINFEYLGAGALRLFVEDAATGDYILVHIILYSNLNTIPSMFNPNFHFMLWVNNKATIIDLVISTASYAFFVEGKSKYFEIHQPQFGSGEKSKSTVTTEVVIFTIRVKALYAGKATFIDTFMELVTASIEASSANNLGKIRIVKNATIGGAPSWADIQATNSVMEIDVAGTASGGVELPSIPLAGKNDKIILSLVDYEILLQVGETLTIFGSSVNAATMKASILWKELF